MSGTVGNFMQHLIESSRNSYEAATGKLKPMSRGWQWEKNDSEKKKNKLVTAEAM